jgi:hypothetical protein
MREKASCLADVRSLIRVTIPELSPSHNEALHLFDSFGMKRKNRGLTSCSPNRKKRSESSSFNPELRRLKAKKQNLGRSG